MPSVKCNNLFVYGSLRSGFKSPAYEYISHFFSLVSEARVRGRLYDLGSYPAAVPAADDLFILGELYTIKNESEFGWALGQLDDYEGVSGEHGETPLYRRELVEVLASETVVIAWIYWYNGQVEGKPLILSGDMIQYLREKNATSPQ